MRFVILRVRSRPYARRSQGRRMRSKWSPPQPVVQPTAPADSPTLMTHRSDSLPIPAALMTNRSDSLRLTPSALRAPAQIDSTSEAHAVKPALPASLIPAFRTAAVSTGFSSLTDGEGAKQKPWLLKPSDLYRTALAAAPFSSGNLGSDNKAFLHSGDALGPKLLTPSALSVASAVSSPDSQLALAVANSSSAPSHSSYSGVTAAPGSIAHLSLSVQHPQASDDDIGAASDALPVVKTAQDSAAGPIADTPQLKTEDSVLAPVADPTRVESEDAMTIVVVGADSCQTKSQVTSMHPVGFIAELDRQLQASKQRLQPGRVEETRDKVLTTGAAPSLPSDSNTRSQPDMQLVQDNLAAVQREVQQSVRDVGVSHALTGAQVSVKTPAKTPATPSSSLVSQVPSQHRPSPALQPLQQQTASLKPMLTKAKSRFAPSSTPVKAKQPGQHSKSVVPLQHELSSASPRIQAVHPQPVLQPDPQQLASRVNDAVLHEEVSSESSQSLVSLSQQHTTAAMQHEPADRSQSTLAQSKADMYLQMGLDADSTQAAVPELQTGDQTASALQSMQHGDTNARTPAAHVGRETQSQSASAVQSVQHAEASNGNAVTANGEVTRPVQQQAACLVPKEEDCLNLYYDEAGNRAAAVDEAWRAALMQRLDKHRQKQATPVKALDSLPHFLREVSCSLWSRLKLTIIRQ